MTRFIICCFCHRLHFIASCTDYKDMFLIVAMNEYVGNTKRLYSMFLIVHRDNGECLESERGG